MVPGPVSDLACPGNAGLNLVVEHREVLDRRAEALIAIGLGAARRRIGARHVVDLAKVFTGALQPHYGVGLRS